MFYSQSWAASLQWTPHHRQTSATAEEENTGWCKHVQIYRGVIIAWNTEMIWSKYYVTFSITAGSKTITVDWNSRGKIRNLSTYSSMFSSNSWLRKTWVPTAICSATCIAWRTWQDSQGCLLVEPAQCGWNVEVLLATTAMLKNNSWLKHQQIHPIRRLKLHVVVTDTTYLPTVPYTSRQATMTVSHTYFSFSSWVEVGNIMPTIVISAMYKDSMKCVVSRGGLRLFQKLIKTKLLWKLVSIREQQRSLQDWISPTFQFSMKLETITTFMAGWYLSLIFTLVSVAGSYWNRIKWRCSTGGKLTKITPFFASWRREEDGWKVEELKSNSKLFQNILYSSQADLHSQVSSIVLVLLLQCLHCHIVLEWLVH